MSKNVSNRDVIHIKVDQIFNLTWSVRSTIVDDVKNQMSTLILASLYQSSSLP